MDNAAKFEQMESLWAMIGVPNDDKKQMIVDLQNASCVMHDKLLRELQESLASVTRTSGNRVRSAGVFHCFRKGNEAAELLSKVHPNSRARLAELQDVSEKLEKEFDPLVARLATTKEHLLDLVSEMWLDTNDLALLCKPLIKVMVADTSVAELSAD